MNFRKLLIILVIMFFITGCKVQKLSNNNLYKNLDIILSNKIKYSNQDAMGYQYYLPTGINVLEVNDFNETLYANNNKYYLYADVVSYYYKIKNRYVVNKSAYVSKKLKYGKKNGYLEINKENGKYYIEMMYNYAKIESIVSENELVDSVTNIAYILSSIKYNDDIVETMLGDQKYDLSDSETYNIFNTKKKINEDQFLKYVNEYDNYNEEATDLIEKKVNEADKDK